MPSSTSNSDPHGGRIWARAGLCVALTLALLELYLRLSGLVPTVTDSKGLWCRQRIQLEGQTRQAVALLGNSRMEAGFVPEVLRDMIPEALPLQLAVSGTTSKAVLRDIAVHTDFSGVVIAAEAWGTLTAVVDGPASQQPWVDFYHSSWQPKRLDANFNHTARMFLQKRLCGLSHRPEQAIKSLFQLQPYPPLVVERRWDRSMPSYHRSRLTDEELKRRQRRVLDDKLPPPPHRPPPSPRRDLADLRHWVSIIQDRGGEVVFVRFPSSGALLAHEQAWFPRADYWDAIHAATGAETVYFTDLGDGNWPCPDLSHLDWDQAHDFTRLLVDELVHRGVLPH